MGRRFCRGAASLFFPEQSPVTAERVAEEEAQPVLASLERPASRAPLAQLQEVGSDLLFGKPIRGAHVMRRQLAHRAGVDLLCSLGQAGQRHIFNHSVT